MFVNKRANKTSKIKLKAEIAKNLSLKEDIKRDGLQFVINDMHYDKSVIYPLIQASKLKDTDVGHILDCILEKVIRGLTASLPKALDLAEAELPRPD